MNHKRKKPKSTRTGCLLCKPWKFMGNSKRAKSAKDLRLEESVKVQLDG